MPPPMIATTIGPANTKGTRNEEEAESIR
jgi:hypothetical protein